MTLKEEDIEAKGKETKGACNGFGYVCNPDSVRACANYILTSL